jgi:hypothetical protein
MKPKVTEWLERLRASATANVQRNKVVVHNRTGEIAPFLRFWVQFPDDRLEVCRCRFAPQLGAHYRVKIAWADLRLPAIGQRCKETY